MTLVVALLAAVVAHAALEGVGVHSFWVRFPATFVIVYVVLSAMERRLG